ncbi:MAG: galactose oxidase-like domain-containing protein [Rhodopila sp.]
MQAQPVHKTESQRDRLLQHQDRYRRAPPDYGFGENVAPPADLIWNHKQPDGAPAAASGTVPVPPSTAAVAADAAAVPKGGPDAAAHGMFGPVLPWPFILIHMGLLPDGRVMNYGTTDPQTDQIYYDVWDPRRGGGTDSHLLLPNQTKTNIFCSGLGLLPDGRLLLTGGDTTIGDSPNFGINNVNIFNPVQNVLTAAGNMAYARWYPTVVPLPDGTDLIVGGIGHDNDQDPTVMKGITVPELYRPSTGLAALPGADNGGTVDWYYPRIYVGSQGTIYDLDSTGTISTYSTSGTGSFRTLGTFMAQSLGDEPTVMFAPGRLLSIRAADSISDTTQTHRVDIVDLRGDQPVVSQTESVPGGREWANATILADGKVFVNGGSGEDNQLVRVSYDSYIWNPETGGWTLGGTATKFRLYHSTALLLPDGSVLTGGGGGPGPVDNLNAEIYYPPYLYSADGSGNPAPRPTIVSASALVKAGQQISLTMGTPDPVSRVTLLRMGAVTHSNDVQQRFFALTFSQSGNTVTAQLPSNGNNLLPGFYMIFAFSSKGTPSVAQVTHVGL